jgi:hypothetical protein
MDQPEPDSPRKRGGQPGNNNAKKHGFYATRLLPEEANELATAKINDVADEIDLMRIHIRRVMEEAAEKTFTFEERLELVSFLCVAVRTLNRLILTHRTLFPPPYRGYQDTPRRYVEPSDGPAADPGEYEAFEYTPITYNKTGGFF